MYSSRLVHFGELAGLSLISECFHKPGRINRLHNDCITNGYFKAAASPAASKKKE